MEDKWRMGERLCVVCRRSTLAGLEVRRAEEGYFFLRGGSYACGFLKVFAE